MVALELPDPPLRDPVVALRPWRSEDAEAKRAAFQDPLVDRFSWPRLTPYTAADARAFLVDQELARRRGYELNFALVAPDDDGALWGGAALNDVELRQRRA
ncbi:MAG: GNAT family N-acetyltransferase, partial [Actinomycetota bacterium]|nr:GNAT family N-acetyltransferase [Actinomycetota bacterium]